MHLADQFDLPGTKDVFNLVLEQTVDGERIAREQAEREQTERAAREFAEKHQLEIL